MGAQLLAFLGISAVVICTPGPDTALTVRNAFAGGRACGVATAAGVGYAPPPGDPTPDRVGPARLWERVGAARPGERGRG